MKVLVTGATGLIGRRLVGALRERGDEVVALSRSSPNDLDGVETVVWDPSGGDPAPADALAGADAVVNLAGEPVAQRWTAAAKERIRASRVAGTERLVEGLLAASPRPSVLVSSSAAGYYGDRGSEELIESASPGGDFLASVCVGWEAAAMRAAAAGVRVALIRTGVVLARGGGALKQMLPPFKAGVGGPVGNGRQYMPWVALDDVVGIYLAALDSDGFSGPINAAAPSAATNREFSKALGRALHRPAVVPVPVFALRLMFGEMASVITSSTRLVPARALELGYEFKCPDLDGALAAALSARD
jgi:uncharacterized protein (TIGR01777 family)